MVLQNVNGSIVDVGDDEPEIVLSEVEDNFVPNLETVNVPDSDLSCEVCGVPLSYAGRGRKPKFCDEHKGKSSSGAIKPDRTATATKTRGFQGESQLRAALEARYMMMPAFAVMLGRPQYAMVMRASIADCVDADIEYARTNLSFRKILEGGVEKSALAAVIVAHAKMIVPIVVGERVRAAAKPPVVPASEPRNGEGNVSSPSFGRRPSGPFKSGPNPQATPPKPTDLFYPAETQSETPDSINAGNLPGMPG